MSNPLGGAVAWPQAAQWSAAVLGRATVDLEPLAGDVSLRRYARLAGQSLLLAAYPPTMHDVFERFLTTTELLREAGVRVPRVFAQDPGLGLMLVEDFGPRTVYDLEEDGVEAALRAAAGQIAAVQGIDMGRVSNLLAPLDAPVLLAEVERTLAEVVTPSGWLSAAELAVLRGDWARLCDRLARTLAPAHRDFMARNLVALGGGELGVLDHQDLRLGPVAYDLASLVTDSVTLPLERRLVLEADLVPAVLRPDFVVAVAQRSIKIVGTFCGFAARGSRRHLCLVAPALANLARVAAECPELSRWQEHFGAWALGVQTDPNFVP